MSVMVLPGTECPTCHRKVPHVHDKPPTKKRERFTVAVPIGEEGVLDEMLVDWVEKLKEVWPRDFELGDQGWRYQALHWGLHVLTTASPETLSQLLPSEVGA